MPMGGGSGEAGAALPAGGPDSGTDGGAVAAPACAPPPAGNRCALVARAAGGDPAIDDFEPVAGESAGCRAIRPGDSRRGAWALTRDTGAGNGSINYALEPPGSGGAASSTRALHVTGTGLSGAGPVLAVTLAACYDASRYQGISFWIRGRSSAAPRVRMLLSTPPTTEAAEGGVCVPRPGEPTGGCRDHFTVDEFLVPEVWTRYAVVWKQLWQTGQGQLAGGAYRPETEILAIQFVPEWNSDVPAGRSVDFWIDDLSFDVSPPFADSGFSQVITQAQFDGTYDTRRGGPARHPLYRNAYADLTAAFNTPEFSRIGREGTADDRKREIAALLAHVAQETGSLQHAVELNPPDIYCDATSALYPCIPGQTYIGRGPIQLSWNFNYGPASLFLGLGDQLLRNPAMVIGDGVLAWKTALYFWMKWKDYGTNVRKVGPHYRFLREGFGSTILVVNGALECPSSPAATSRGVHYQAFCAAVGVGGCNQNLACPPM